MNQRTTNRDLWKMLTTLRGRRKRARPRYRHISTSRRIARVIVLEELMAESGVPHVDATVINHHPSSVYPDGLSALTDALVLQMFDSDLGEALRIAYTTIQQHQERQSRRAQLGAAADGLRAHLARLDEAAEHL